MGHYPKLVHFLTTMSSEVEAEIKRMLDQYYVQQLTESFDLMHYKVAKRFFGAQMRRKNLAMMQEAINALADCRWLPNQYTLVKAVAHNSSISVI